MVVQTATAVTISKINNIVSSTNNIQKRNTTRYYLPLPWSRYNKKREK
jgi:hypothetical protein